MGYGHFRLNYPETFCDFFQVGDAVVGSHGEAGQVTRAWTTTEDYYDNTNHFVELRQSDGALIVRAPWQLRKVSLLDLVAIAAHELRPAPGSGVVEEQDRAQS